MTLKHVVRAAFMAAALAGMTQGARAGVEGGGGNVAPCDPEVAEAWADRLYFAIKDTAIPPMVAARRIGYFGITLHEAVIGCRPLGRSLDGQLNELSGVPDPDPSLEYFWPASANAAARRVMDGLFATAPQGVKDGFASLEHSFEHDYGNVDEAVLERSVAYGRAVADSILTYAATDGFTENDSCPFEVPQGPGLWRPTPPAFRQDPLQPCWGDLRTFAMPDNNSCDPGAPPEFSTDPSSFFYQQALDVYETVSALTEDEEEIAHFWSDDPGATGTPPGHWLSIAEQMIDDQNLDLGDAGEILARTGIAVHDAFVIGWHIKYEYNLLRPVTYIQDNIDEDWMPMLVTPPFPEYISGHSIQSGAASAVLFDMLGPVAFTDHTNDFRDMAPRSFSSFHDAAHEAADSRMYGGIHYDFSDDLGVTSGECVGDQIARHVTFDRCAPGDIHPNGAGDGRIGLGDVALGARKLFLTILVNARDTTCGDLHPGQALCDSGAATNWCPSGDGRFTLGDFLVLRRLARREVRVNCRECPFTNDSVTAAWVPGDVTRDGVANIGDVVRALRVSVGLEEASLDGALCGDVAPLTADGEAGGDGALDITDAIALLRSSVGLGELRWPARTLQIVLDAPAERTAFSLTLTGVPAWATPVSHSGEGCDTAVGDGLDEADGTWALTCVGDTSPRTAAGVLGSITYRAPRALGPELALQSEILDASLAASPAVPRLSW